MINFRHTKIVFAWMLKVCLIVSIGLVFFGVPALMMQNGSAAGHGHECPLMQANPADCSGTSVLATIRHHVSLLTTFLASSLVTFAFVLTLFAFWRRAVVSPIQQSIIHYRIHRFDDGHIFAWQKLVSWIIHVFRLPSPRAILGAAPA